MEQAKLDVLTWDTVFARWATHGVPLVTVVGKKEDLYERRWLNKAGTEFACEFENPPRDTANLLQAGKVTATPEKFCAFAVLAAIRESGTHLEYDDVRRRLWVLAHAFCLGEDGGDLWPNPGTRRRTRRNRVLRFPRIRVVHVGTGRPHHAPQGD